MSGLLETPQHDDPKQMAHMKAVGCGIKAGINDSRLFSQPGTDSSIVRCLIDQSAPPQIGNQVSVALTAIVT